MLDRSALAATAALASALVAAACALVASLSAFNARDAHGEDHRMRSSKISGKQFRGVGHVRMESHPSIEEGHLMPDHVHMLISIPPKYSVAQIIGYMKAKSSIWIAQNVERKMRNFLGHKFWARGYFVTTVGRDWREEAQLCRALLGKRLFRLDHRSRRSRDTGVHQKPGARGRPLGPNEYVALIGHLDSQRMHGHVSDPDRRFERPYS